MTPESLFDLSGKTALVTGGGTGIGLMAAEGLAAAGASVFIASRNAKLCQQQAKALNAKGYKGHVDGFAGDVGLERGVAELAKALLERTETLSILVNNAGRTWGKALPDFPYDAWDKVMSVNVTGLFALTQALLPILKASATRDDPARVVNLGSVMGDQPMGDGAYSYAASKAAVHHLTQILAKELAPDFISVNALAPGPFVSKMTAFVTEDPKARDVVASTVPMARLGKPSDIAGAIQFLCSQAGAYVTGAIIPLSGGVNVTTGPALFDDALKAKSGG